MVSLPMESQNTVHDEWRALLDEDSDEKHEKLFSTFALTQQAVFMKLKFVGIVEEADNWVL